jgi:hypothetical protein
MAARLSALRAGSFIPPGRFLVLISVRSWADPKPIVRLEGLGKLKKKIHLIQDSNQRLSSLKHSASTNYATACPVSMLELATIWVWATVLAPAFTRNVMAVYDVALESVFHEKRNICAAWLRFIIWVYYRRYCIQPIGEMSDTIWEQGCEISRISLLRS